jgi:hypothetical protein
MSRFLSSITRTIVVLYVALIFLRPAGLIPANLDAALSALLPMMFAMIHGSRQYGWRGTLAFAVICLVVSNASRTSVSSPASHSATITTATIWDRSSFSFQC